MYQIILPDEDPDMEACILIEYWRCLTEEGMQYEFSTRVCESLDAALRVISEQEA